MNIIRRGIIGVLVSISHFYFAQISSHNTIKGSVTDEVTKEKIVGVSIALSELRRIVKTDENGNYELNGIMSGTYYFEVFISGYKTNLLKIKVAGDSVIDFVLSPSVKEINDVIIKKIDSRSRSPIIIKSLEIKQLNQDASTNLIDALKNVPGVNQVTSGPGISKPIIRGLGYNRIISLYNGIRQEGQQWGDEHGVEIDEYAIDHVLIVKGPGSLMYGSDGIAGVISFFSGHSLPNGTVRSQVLSNYQSNNNLFGHSFANYGNKKGINWSVRLSHKIASNYQNKLDGKVYNSGFSELNGTVFLRIQKKWGYTNLNLSSYNAVINMPEGERDSLGQFVLEKTDKNGTSSVVSATQYDLKGYEVGFPHQMIKHKRVMSNTLIMLKKGVLVFDFGFQNNNRAEFGNVKKPSEAALLFDLNTITYSSRYNLNAIKKWETSIGVSGMIQQNKNKGLEFIIPEYLLWDAGVYVSTQKTMGKTTFACGIRVENRSCHSDELFLNPNKQPSAPNDTTSKLKFSSIKRNYNNISGSIGVSRPMSDKSTIKCNLSRGYRAPNIAEIASNGRHEGAFRYEYGESNLKCEISHQLDLAYFFNSNHVVFEFTPFVNLISNYIYLKKLSSENGGDSIPDLSDSSPAFKYAFSNATLAGGEVYLEIHPHPYDWLIIEQSFSCVQATQNNQADSLKYLPFIPAPRYRAIIKAQFKNVTYLLPECYVKFGIDYFFEQNKYFRAYNTETATPSYLLMNAGIGGVLKTKNLANFLTIYASVENLADIAYQNHLSRLKYAPINPVSGNRGIYNMGRNISLKLILNF